MMKQTIVLERFIQIFAIYFKISGNSKKVISLVPNQVAWIFQKK
jgi:hypothetical protein